MGVAYSLIMKAVLPKTFRPCTPLHSRDGTRRVCAEPGRLCSIAVEQARPTVTGKRLFVAWWPPSPPHPPTPLRPSRTNSGVCGVYRDGEKKSSIFSRVVVSIRNESRRRGDADRICCSVWRGVFWSWGSGQTEPGYSMCTYVGLWMNCIPYIPGCSSLGTSKLQSGRWRASRRC